MIPAQQPTGPRPPKEDTSAAELVCPACARTVPRDATTVCAICARRVCLACVGPYGHHMRACDDCRLADW